MDPAELHKASVDRASLKRIWRFLSPYKFMLGLYLLAIIAAAVVGALRHQPGGDIIVLASGSVIKALLRADALDRLSITLCPEVAGGGAPLFEDVPRSSWALRQTATTGSGALCLLYDRVPPKQE